MKNRVMYSALISFTRRAVFHLMARGLILNLILNARAPLRFSIFQQISSVQKKYLMQDLFVSWA
jgi:hypothetical protein